MIYSVHDQIRGDFVYFEGPDRIPINDDQPVPDFAPELITKLGIAASDAGRPLPEDAVQVGRGPLPRGKVSTGVVGTEKKGSFLGPSPDGIGGWFPGTSTDVSCFGPICSKQVNNDSRNIWVVGAVTAIVGFAFTTAFLRRRAKK